MPRTQVIVYPATLSHNSKEGSQEAAPPLSAQRDRWWEEAPGLPSLSDPQARAPSTVKLKPQGRWRGTREGAPWVIQGPIRFWQVLGSRIRSWSTEGVGVGNVSQLLPVTSRAVHLFIFFNFYLVIWLCQVSVVAYRIVSLH